VLVAGGAIAAVWSLIHAPFGYALRALRDSETRAAAIGIDRFRVQWQAFVLAGSFAGLAGSLFVFSKGSLSPDTLSIPRSMDGLVMVLLGGVQTLIGPVVGAVVFTGLQDWITRVTPYWQAVLGASVILLTVVFPAGIVGSLKSRWLLWNGGRA
jgi:branched-chain amino acid transport system permease protein